MITNVRQGNPMALPRFLRNAMKTIRTNGVTAQEEREAKQERGFFESYEKMMESQAILVLGLQNKRW